MPTINIMTPTSVNTVVMAILFMRNSDDLSSSISLLSISLRTWSILSKWGSWPWIWISLWSTSLISLGLG